MSTFGSPAFRSELLADADDVLDGPDGLSAKGVLFAFEPQEGRLVVDLPDARARDLIARGIGEPAESAHPAKGRWVAVTDTADWVELATEAHQFVGERPVGGQS